MSVPPPYYPDHAGGQPPYQPQGYPPPQQGYGGYPPVTQQPMAQPQYYDPQQQQQQYYEQQQQQQQYYEQQPMHNMAPPAFAPPIQAEDGAWMGPVAQQMVPLNCPPGLEYLTLIDQLIIKQKVEMMEALTGAMGFGFETKNRYKIKNSLGQNVYKAKEDTDCCTRNLCGTTRPFDMAIKDNNDTEVIHLNRPLRCQSCLFPCCLQEMEVSSPPGNLIGIVKQNWSIIKPSFSVCDDGGNEILRIVGPWCTFSICGDVTFKIMTPDESTEVGRISKQWSGLLKEAFTDADNFGISFPMDLDVRAKATLLGACFLIDYMFFEMKGNKDDDGFGML